MLYLQAFAVYFDLKCFQIKRCQLLFFAAVYFTGMGVLRGTGTAATLFWGEPSITRSE